MKLGDDTGFLIGVIEQNAVALHHWQGVLDGRHRLVLSTLTIHELLVHYYKRGQGDTVKQLIAQIGFDKKVTLSREELLKAQANELGERYFYIKAQQRDGDQIYSAPVWITVSP